MKAKYLMASVALLLSVAVALFFSVFPWKIGTPAAATMRYWSDATQEYHKLTLTKTQLEELTDILRSATPTVFLHEHEGINNEDVLFTLLYSDGSQKEFSLYSNRTFLYEGCAENLVMASMHGQFIHFGGSLGDEMATYLQKVCTDPPQSPEASE